MSEDIKVIVNRSDIVGIAEEVRSKTGNTTELTLAQIKSGIANISSSSAPSNPQASSRKEVNFYDYDGTILYSYTVEEAQALISLPALPSHKGLICQGWNYDLATIKDYNRAVEIGAMYITDDGKTRIYIHLEEGRTSPMLGCCLSGTVTVDWGDGTTPDTLTSNNSYTTSRWTPNHTYANAGNYVITLTINGSMGFEESPSTDQSSSLLKYSYVSDNRNYVYQNAIQKIEIGNSVTSIGNSAFRNCCSLSSITIPNSVTSIGNSAFYHCYGIRVYDFTSHTSVPTLSNTNHFNGISSDCAIKVPASLYDEWIAATNWSTYASYIVAV